MGSLESIGAALSAPSISSLMSQGAVHRELSRRQGLYATSNTAALAVAAGTSGFLFTHQLGVALHVARRHLGRCSRLTTLWWWRNVTGNITDTASTT